MSGSADDPPAIEVPGAREGDAARREALAGLSLDKGGSFAPRRRRRLPRALVWIIVLAGLAASFLVFRMATAVPVVRTGSVQRSSPIAESELTTANGYVRARTRASLASKTQGRLVQVEVDEGDTVAAGQLLAVVDHDEVDASLLGAAARIDAQRREVSHADALIDEGMAARTSAVALVAERNAALDAARASLAGALAQYGRVEDLVASDILAESELDVAREARDVAAADVRRAEAGIATAETDVSRADAALASANQAREVARANVAVEEAEAKRLQVVRDQAYINAPFAGVVLRRDAEPGEVVSPANTGGTGSKTAVVTLADFATLEVEVDVYERDIARIAVGAPCRITLDAFADRALQAKVRLLRPTADRTRSTVQVYVEFAMVPEFARPEMVARVTFYRSGTDVLTKDRVFAPQGAATTRDGREGVFVLRGEQLRFVPVRFGTASDGRREVLDGVEAGAVVVLDPSAELTDGATVAVGS